MELAITNPELNNTQAVSCKNSVGPQLLNLTKLCCTQMSLLVYCQLLLRRPLLKCCSHPLRCRNKIPQTHSLVM